LTLAIIGYRLRVFSTHVSISDDKANSAKAKNNMALSHQLFIAETIKSPPFGSYIPVN
jgi:hypothetical protein